MFVESVAIEFDSTNKFVVFITSKRSVEALHFSTQIDVAINILLLCVVQNVSEWYFELTYGDWRLSFEYKYRFPLWFFAISNCQSLISFKDGSFESS